MPVLFVGTAYLQSQLSHLHVTITTIIRKNMFLLGILVCLLDLGRLTTALVPPNHAAVAVHRSSRLQVVAAEVATMVVPTELVVVAAQAPMAVAAEADHARDAVPGQLILLQPDFQRGLSGDLLSGHICCALNGEKNLLEQVAETHQLVEVITYDLDPDIGTDA